jgi:hypothetical protein
MPTWLLLEQKCVDYIQEWIEGDSDTLFTGLICNVLWTMLKLVMWQWRMTIHILVSLTSLL